MRFSTTTKVIIGILVLAVLGAAYYGISPLFRNIEVQDELPSIEENSEEGDLAPEEPMDMGEPDSSNVEESVSVEQMVTGPFPITGTTGHSASGSVRVFQTGSETVIRYEDFETINGPNLHVYLSKDLDANEYVDIGPLKGTRGNINYAVPEGIDVREYNYVLVWCVPFGVLFNYAPLN